MKGKKAQIPSSSGAIVANNSQKSEPKFREERKKKEEKILHSMSRLHQEMIKKAAEGIHVDILSRTSTHSAEMMAMEILHEEEIRKPPDPSTLAQMQVDHDDQIIDVVMQQGDSGSGLQTFQTVSQ